MWNTEIYDIEDTTLQRSFRYWALDNDLMYDDDDLEIDDPLRLNVLWDDFMIECDRDEKLKNYIYWRK